VATVAAAAKTTISRTAVGKTTGDTTVDKATVGQATDGEPAGAESNVAGWLGTQLEVSRRLRTDAEFANRWSARVEAIAGATRDRLRRQYDAGVIRSDVDLDVLAQFLELAYDGLVLHLAMGRPRADLERVLDLVEAAVRR